MAFNDATRQKYTALNAQSRVASTGNVVSWDLPRVGLLSRIYIAIRGTISSLNNGTPNTLGMCSQIQRVRLIANSGIDIFSVSGPGYHYLLRPYFDLLGDPNPQSNGRSALSAAATNLDMIIPVALNLRDPLGLWMLQNEQTLLTLQITFAPDSAINSAAVGYTTALTATPYIEYFTVPDNTQDWPNLNIIHQILEDQVAVSGAGSFTYQWPRGNTYLQLMQGMTNAVPFSGSAGTTGFLSASSTNPFSQVQLRVNQSDYLINVGDVTSSADPFFEVRNPLIRPSNQLLTGTVPFDFMGTAGLGNYDQMRDVINSRLLTDLASVMQATGAGTYFAIRRQLVGLG